MTTTETLSTPRTTGGRWGPIRLRGSSRRKRLELISVVMVVPAVVLLAFIQIIPLVGGVKASLGNADGKYVGLRNYRELWADPIWHQALLNAGKGVLLTPLVTILPLAIAFFLFTKITAWRLFRSLFFMSYLLPAAMCGIIFSGFLGPRGPWAYFASDIRAPASLQLPLSDAHLSIFAVYAVALWSGFGFGVVLYMAAMSAIPRDQFEAAALDGASLWVQFWRLIIPEVAPTIAFLCVLHTSSVFLRLFPLIFTLSGGGPGYSSYVPEYYAYQTFTQPEVSGYASAIGIMLFLIALALTGIQVRFMYDRLGK